MNILHVSAIKSWGGGENHIQNLVSEMAIIQPDVVNLILCVKNAKFHNILKSTNLPYKTAALAHNMDFRYAFKMVKLCRIHEIDIIHIHDPTALTLTIMADKLKKLPPFILSKKTSFSIKNRKRTLYKYNYPKIKRILCVSDKTKEVAGRSIEDRKKLVRIYHGTNLKTKGTSTDFNLRKKLGLPENIIIIGMLANHIRAKHMETWVNVMDILVNHQHRKDFYFVQFGEFDKYTNLTLNLIKEKKLESNCSIFGYHANASNYIPQFNISLLTSQSEGLPQFIYESMYHKTPVISTNVGGIPEVLENGINGFLTEPHQPEALAEKIIELATDEKLQKIFSEKSHTKLLKNFTSTKMAEQTFAEYKNIYYGKY
mgnify:CR=1 FL=1